MYPNLWTIPGIDFHIRTYGFIVGLSFVIALLIARRRARFGKLDPGVMTNLTLIGMVGGLIGGPLMYFFHYGNFGGREVIGGVVLGTIFAVGYLLLTGRSILRYVDAAIPSLILAMGIGRLGCLMFGCCWGGACQTDSGDRAMPWAIQFPYGSPLYVKNWIDGNQDVPQDLLWKHPVSKEMEPIPAPILETDIDSDEELKTWASTAYAFNEARKANLPKPEMTAVSKAYADAKKALTQRDPLILGAAVHWAKLNGSSSDVKKTWNDLRVLAKSQHTDWVHPAQIYDFIALTLLFFVLSAIYWKRCRPGTVLVWAMILYPLNRVLQEMIRTDNPHDMIGGLTISQFASLGIFVIGVALAIWLARAKSNAPTRALSHESD
ncbi:MAG: hypothetical protein DHS20C16_27940 [Phycisphaerae bacterium]|nr:MAG: hypothetical protein DHS20C16_27940 [Phycisphaerae bacterium]